MLDEALQRTVRRCVASVLIPLSLLVFQFRQYVAAEAYSHQLPGVLTAVIPVALLVGAICYLVLSTLQIDRPEPADRRSRNRDDEDTDGTAESA